MIFLFLGVLDFQTLYATMVSKGIKSLWHFYFLVRRQDVKRSKQEAQPRTYSLKIFVKMYYEQKNAGDNRRGVVIELVIGLVIGVGIGIKMP